MKNILKSMEKNLTPEKAEMLSHIFEPTAVAFPCTAAVANFTVLRDGEIRYYCNDLKKNHIDKGVRAYLSTKDCGLTWEKHYQKDSSVIGNCIYVPEKDIYVKFANAAVDGHVKFPNDGNGIYVLISAVGPDDTAPAVYKVYDGKARIFRHVIYVESSGLLIATAEDVIGDTYHTVVFTSSDEGKTWDAQYLNPLPDYPVNYPDKGKRWQNHSCEPTIVQLTENELMIIFRTSYNYHYKYMSYDGGRTWNEPMPTDFHATLTMPTIKRMTDGDIIFTWCNTQPLPEFDHSKSMPPLSETELRGRFEDCFTNRDANHIAVSTDNAKTWQGFREMALNPVRNSSDFRTVGGSVESLDKSVHQFEIVELPMNKLMVAYGQHNCCATIIVLDRNWIKEKYRYEDFSCGLENVSTHIFLKSNIGNYRGTYSGHCALNRTHGAVMMPDPDMNSRDVLFISRIKDDRLLSEVQGAVWNFPAGRKGTLRFQMRNRGKGLAVSLTDRWFNPIDTYVREDAQISVNIDNSCIEDDKWIVISISWDCDKESYTVYADESKICDGVIKGDCPNGICYVHFQSLAQEPDALGTYIGFIEKKE